MQKSALLITSRTRRRSHIIMAASALLTVLCGNRPHCWWYHEPHPNTTAISCYLHWKLEDPRSQDNIPGVCCPTNKQMEALALVWSYHVIILLNLNCSVRDIWWMWDRQTWPCWTTSQKSLGLDSVSVASWGWINDLTDTLFNELPIDIDIDIEMPKTQAQDYDFYAYADAALDNTWRKMVSSSH